jgi:hypothetical protein
VSFAPNPKGNDSDLEWIEIENREKREVNLKDFSIATGTKKKSIANHPIREDFVVPAKSVKRLTRKHSLFTLGNERGHVELRSPDGKVLQDLKYKFDKSLADDAVLRKEKGQTLALVAAPVEPADLDLETEAAASDTPSVAEMEAIIPTETPEETAPPIEAGSEPEPKKYPSETIESQKLSWADMISYGTPFSLPQSFVPKASAAAEPLNERATENENAPRDWRDVINETLNRWLN